jgi:hypothetical protein
MTQGEVWHGVVERIGGVGLGGPFATRWLLAESLGIRAVRRTKSTLPFPVSFTENGKVVSSPVSWSLIKRKA